MSIPLIARASGCIPINADLARHVRRHVRRHPSAFVVRLGDPDPLLRHPGACFPFTGCIASKPSAPISSTVRKPPANRRRVSTQLPRVTIQLPLYNERYVLERLIDETVKIEYPRELLQIQVLDDSTDDTHAVRRSALRAIPQHRASDRVSPPHQSRRLQGRRAAGRAEDRPPANSSPSSTPISFRPPIF